MGPFIHVRSHKFRVLPGEEEELVNEGMYGKALAEYLQQKLQDRGYRAPFVCAEDWGWWVELEAPFSFGACIYCGEREKEPHDFFCTDGVSSPKKWSWKKFRFFDTRPWAARLRDDLLAIFKEDSEVEVLGADLEWPEAR